MTKNETYKTPGRNMDLNYLPLAIQGPTLYQLIYIFHSVLTNTIRLQNILDYGLIKLIHNKVIKI